MDGDEGSEVLRRRNEGTNDDDDDHERNESKTMDDLTPTPSPWSVSLISANIRSHLGWCRISRRSYLNAPKRRVGKRDRETPRRARRLLENHLISLELLPVFPSRPFRSLPFVDESVDTICEELKRKLEGKGDESR